MTSKNDIQSIKSNAAELLSSLSTEVINLPMMSLNEKAEGMTINKRFHRMTIRAFLSEVCRIHGNIPKPYCAAVEAVSTIFNAKREAVFKIDEASEIIKENDTTNKLAMDVSAITLLGKGESPLFERILDAINCAIYYMKNGGYKGCVRQAAVIDDYCNNTGNYEITSKTYDCTRQNVEQAVKRFIQLFLEGKVWSGCDDLYKIDPSLIKEIHEVAYDMVGRLNGDLNGIIGNVKGKPLTFILRMIDCEVSTIGNGQFIVEKGKSQYYTKIADTARRTLSKSVEPLPFSKLSEGLNYREESFLLRYLSLTTGVKFLEGNNVIMTGKDLEKAVRQARIISEADGWISKEEIARRYEDEYGEPIGAFPSPYLHKLGCNNHNKLGFWGYGTEKTGKVKDIILTIMTQERPIATFATILKAVRAKGLLYPKGTIRACITDLACPENKNHDLFCLKGYTHLYPTLSWRSYKKQPA